MSDYRIIIKVQNGRIYERIRAAGFKNIAAFCKAHNLNPSQVGKLLNLKDSPVDKNNLFRVITKKIADALGTDPEDLFTERQYEPLPSNVRDVLIDEGRVAQLLAPSNEPERMLAFKEMADGIIGRAHLKKREKQVIAMRFRNGMTLEECGTALGVTRERIRGIEAKALRKMRHPDAIMDITSEDLEE